MIKNTLTKVGLLAIIAFALVSCYPGGAEYLDETDIIYTNYNQDFNFGEVKTYYLDDSIQHVLDEGKNPDRSLDKYIVSELERNFDALGWERIIVEDPNNPGDPPDVAVVLTLVKVKNVQYYGYPWYPGWGGGWYWYYKGTNYWGYPGYGWGYPWYGGSYVTSYETGTLVFDLFNPENIDEDDETVYVEWTGGLNGVLGSSTPNTKTRITNGIDQAFRQSPYLNGNQ